MGFSRTCVWFYYVGEMKKITKITEIVWTYTLSFYVYIKVSHNNVFIITNRPTRNNFFDCAYNKKISHLGLSSLHQTILKLKKIN